MNDPTGFAAHGAFAVYPYFAHAGDSVAMSPWPWWVDAGLFAGGLVIGGVVLGGLLVRAYHRRDARWFKLLSQAMDEGVMVHEKGCVTDFNDALLRMTGYTREEFLKLNPVEALTHPDSYDTVRENMVRGGESPYLVKGVRKDGSSYQAELRPKVVRTPFGTKRIVVIRDLSTLLDAESARAASEARYRNLFDCTVEALVFHKAGEVIDINTAFELLFGYSRTEVIAKDSIGFIVHPDFRNEVRRRIAAQDQRSYEIRAVTREGRVLDIEVIPREVSHDGENFRVTAMRDITLRKRAEARLARQVSLFQATLEASDEGVLVVNTFGNIESSNHRFTEMWDVPGGLMAVGDDERLLAHMADLVVNREDYLARMKELYSRPSEESDDVVELKDGRVFERHSRPQILYGEPVGRVWSFRDITELEKGRRELRRQVALMDATLESTTEGVLVMDTDGGIELVNSRFFTLMGLDAYAPTPLGKDELLARVLPLVSDREKFLADIGRLLDQPEESFTDTLRLKSGRVLERNASPQRYEGRVIGRVLTYRDMTRDLLERDALRHFNAELELRVRERTAELERTNLTLRSANSELEAFSSSVSHDLRSPLRGVDGLSLALSEEYSEQLDETGRDYLRRIRSGVQRMGRIMDDLIHLSRVSRAELKHEPVDLSALARGVVATLRQDQGERTVIVDIAEGAVAYGDKRLLRVVMENLVGNAWKYSSKKQAAVILFGFENGGGGQRRFFVRDNGAGFDPAYKDKLFETFTRLHGPQEFEGTGIGLAIVGRIVKRHGGEIAGDGEVGKGATFTFSLPMPPDANPPGSGVVV